MATARDIVTQAFYISGIIGDGQTASGNQINRGLTLLNRMIAQWRRNRWLVYALETNNLTSTGAASYTVGAGGDFNITRPDTIDSAFVRLLNGNGNTDYPLEIIQAREDYNKITLKSLVTFPSILFYDSAYPLGVAYFWPVPNANQYGLYITTKVVLQSFSNLSETVVLPEEYLAALEWNLAKKLRVAYQLPSNADVNAEAKDALNVISVTNTQVPELSMPSNVVRKGRYNIYSDTND